MSNQAEKYRRKHDFLPYTKADGKAVSEEFDMVQAHLDKLPTLRNDGKGFAVNFVIPEPTEDNHPATYGQLRTGQHSVLESKRAVEERAEEVEAAAQQVSRDAESAASAKQHALSAEQTATEKANIATTQAQIATEKADSIKNSSNIVEQARQNALNSETNARKWAVNPENNAVSGGEFSAYHHAVKARKSKESAEQSAITASSAKDSALSSKEIASQKATEATNALAQINSLKSTTEQKAKEALNSATQAQRSAQTATEKAALITGEAERASTSATSAESSAQSASESARRAEVAASSANTTPVINNLTSTSTSSALSAAMGKALQDEKLSKTDAIFNQKRGYYKAITNLSGKKIIKINLPRNIGITGIINISILGSWGDEDASGLIEMRGAIGINPGRVWGQSLDCTKTFGKTKSNFYLEPTVHMGGNNTPFIKLHKRKNNNNPVYIYVELISDNNLSDKEITFEVSSDSGVISDRENDCAVSFTALKDKPTTLSGYGVTLEIYDGTDSTRADVPVSANVAKRLKDLIEGKTSLTGNQQIDGEKTFKKIARFQNSIRFATTENILNANKYGEMGADDDNTHWRFNHSGGGTVRIHRDGRFTYNNNPIWHSGNLSFNVKRMPRETDVNTLKSDGIYAFTDGGVNLPSRNAYHLIVISGNDSRWCRQIAFRSYSDEIQHRTLASLNGAWGEWKEIGRKPKRIFEGSVSLKSTDSTVQLSEDIRGKFAVFKTLEHGQITVTREQGTGTNIRRLNKIFRIPPISTTINISDNYSDIIVFIGGENESFECGEFGFRVSNNGRTLTVSKVAQSQINYDLKQIYLL
ncbi:hypothetical protein [Pasteurella sp. PK-2025]|uniref:pyocin knob domain-containing protein n=1 Tax=Pasteurella sp. PK-2025 TaxID=3413133 RepID=UPI003C763A83